MSKRKKIDDGVLQEDIGPHWERLFDSGEHSDILLCVKGKNGDELLKVRRDSLVKK